MLLTGGASITAGTGGVGIHTKDIDVSVITATVDGGATGTGMLVEDSAYAWLYPMDVSGNVGIHAINSEILWDVGTSDANTAIRTENVRGTIQSITDNSASSSSATGHTALWKDLHPSGQALVNNGASTTIVGTGVADICLLYTSPSPRDS